MKLRLFSDGFGSTLGALLFAFWLTPAESLTAFDLDLERVGGYHDTGYGSVAVSGQYAYCGWPGGLDVIDLSNPAQPKLVHRYDTSHWFYGLPVSTNFMYKPDAEETWMVYDVSNPADPQQVGGYKTIASAHFNTSASRTKVAGTYAYVTDEDATPLQIIDVRNPANPQRVGSYDPIQYAPDVQDVAVSGTFAYLAAGDDGLQIIDVSNPLTPLQRSAVSGIGNATTVAVDSHYAYVGGFGDLQVVDIRDPAKPQVVAHYPGYDAFKLAISGSYACLGGASWLTFVDISDPTNPKLAGRSGMSGPTGVAIAGRYAYIMGWLSGLHIFEMRPANPQRLAELQFGKVQDGTVPLAQRVTVSGNYAFVADDKGTVHILDIRDPENPQQVGDFALGGEIYAFAPSGFLVSVVGNGLVVFDLHQPANPQLLGSVNGLPGNFTGLALSGHYAYVTSDAIDTGAGLHVFDINDPVNPRLLGQYLLPGGASGVAVSGQYACLTTLGLSCRSLWP
jgi:hypothetical protein